MSPFTAFYDYSMDTVVYDDWLALLKRLFPKQQATCLDLGCGTANLTLALAQAGFSMEGLDLSEDMLIQAYDNQLEENCFFPLYQIDMRDLDGLGSYDLIMSSLDCLCYFNDFSDIKAVITTASEHVKPNGYFVFDVHSLYKIRTVFPGFQYHDFLGDDAFLWSCYFGEVADSVVHELTAFIYDSATASYQRTDSELYEYGYSRQQYKEALVQAGFKVVDILGDGAKESAKDTSERLYFVCQKL